MKIEEVHIENFRSIKKQTIGEIREALILIGKNNAGKSAIINAIRILWGDVDLEKGDFYKGLSNIFMEVKFSISDKYLKTLFYDNKVGFIKIPSSGVDFNSVKKGTNWETSTYTDYKEKRNEFRDGNNIDELEEKIYAIWINAIKNKYSIINNQLIIQLKADKDNCKSSYYIDGKEIKDVIALFPKIAFINDDRNFSEEETGKSKTFTANIFNNVLIDRVYNKSQISLHEK